MVMASVDLFDLLSFKLLEDSTVEIVSKIQMTKNKEDNLMYKVARYLQDEYNISSGVEITIKKEIPIAAGLAGGSADAAATLRGLSKLWNLNLDLGEMAKIGEKFGADIPFCIYNKLAIARGKGEDLVFIDHKLNIPLLLINPNIRISTKDVFEKLKIEQLQNKKISEIAVGIYNKNFNIIEKELFNSLESVAFEMEPKIREIKNQILDHGIKGVLMSGSGATIFAISKERSKLKKVSEVFNDHYYKKLTKIR